MKKMKIKTKKKTPLRGEKDKKKGRKKTKKN